MAAHAEHTAHCDCADRKARASRNATGCDLAPPTGHAGNVRLGQDVICFVDKEIGYMYVGDDQEEEAMTPTLTPPSQTVAAFAAEERCDRCTAGGKLRIM